MLRTVPAAVPSPSTPRTRVEGAQLVGIMNAYDYYLYLRRRRARGARRGGLTAHGSEGGPTGPRRVRACPLPVQATCTTSLKCSYAPK